VIITTRFVPPLGRTRRSVGPEGRQQHTESVQRWTDSFVSCVHQAVKYSRVARRGRQYMVENQFTNKQINNNYEVLLRRI